MIFGCFVSITLNGCDIFIHKQMFDKVRAESLRDVVVQNLQWDKQPSSQLEQDHFWQHHHFSRQFHQIKGLRCFLITQPDIIIHYLKPSRVTPVKTSPAKTKGNSIFANNDTKRHTLKSYENNQQTIVCIFFYNNFWNLLSSSSIFIVFLFSRIIVD